MKAKSNKDHFEDVRGRLGKVWRREMVDAWLAAPNRHLGNVSPARAIHSGRAGEVRTIVDAIVKAHG